MRFRFAILTSCCERRCGANQHLPSSRSNEKRAKAAWRALKEAQDLMIHRLGRLDPQTVRAIFTEAGSRRWTPKQLRRLRDSGSRNPEEATLDEWTNTFLKRIREIKSAPNCKAN